MENLNTGIGIKCGQLGVCLTHAGTRVPFECSDILFLVSFSKTKHYPPQIVLTIYVDPLYLRSHKALFSDRKISRITNTPGLEMHEGRESKW